MSATRWLSRVNAAKSLRYNLPIINNSLLEIFESANDNITKNIAHSIAEKIANYKFILSVLCWYDILQRINIVSKSLQSHQINIPQCINLMENIIVFLRKYRENSFVNIEINTKDIATQMNVSLEFPSVLQFRLWTQFINQCLDEPITDAKQKFNVEFFTFEINKSTLTVAKTIRECFF